MKRILYVLAICLMATVYSCKSTDKGNAGNAAETEKAKKDSIENANLLKQAGDMNSTDSNKTKKDSANKPK